MSRKSLSFFLAAALILSADAYAGIRKVTNKSNIYGHVTSSDGLVDFYYTNETCTGSCGFPVSCACYDSVDLSTSVNLTHMCVLREDCYPFTWEYGAFSISGNHSRVAFYDRYEHDLAVTYSVSTSTLDLNFSNIKTVDSLFCSLIVEDCPPSPPFAEGGDITYSGNLVVWEDENDHIFIANYDGTAMTYLTSGSDSDIVPRVDDIGTRVVFMRNASTICSIFADGTNLICSLSGVNPDISGDGNLLFYHNSGDYFMNRANFDQTGPVTIFPYTFDSACPSYDGSKVAFDSGSNILGTNTDGNSEVFRMNGDGTGIEQITNTTIKSMGSVYLSGDAQTVTWLNACDNQVYLYRDSIVTPPPVLNTISPVQADPGTTLNVTITSTYTNFKPGITTVSFSGTGITVNNVIVNCDLSLVANITISPGALSGMRNVTATTGTEVVTKPAAFMVGSVPSIAGVSPDQGNLGATLNVTITGSFTHFINGITTVAFSGTGVTVNSATVNSSTSVVANITISPGATVGLRDVTVTTGSEVVYMTDAFWVGPPAIEVSPFWGRPGDTGKVLTITGSGTHFGGGSVVTFSGGYISVMSKNVISSTLMTVTVNISGGAPTYSTIVTVTTGAEVITKADGFRIYANGIPTVSPFAYILLAMLLAFVSGFYWQRRSFARE